MPNDFDIASKHYDENFSFSNIGIAQRDIVFKHINPIINNSKKLSILELNCGTGVDAIRFGNLGHDVIATDISEGMITVAKAKEHKKSITFKVQDVNTISETTFNQTFDIIFSNFGGLNCISSEELKKFLVKSQGLLNNDGKLVLVIMPKNCLWERFYFSLKGDFKKAKRRNTTKSVIANVDGVEVRTWYYNPNDITKLTKGIYKTKKIRPIGLTIPPSYLEKFFFAKKPFLLVFKGIDTLLKGSYFAKYSDHFLIELNKGQK